MIPREASLSSSRSKACDAGGMVHERDRQIPREARGDDAVERVVQAGELLPAGADEQQRHVGRQIVDGLAGAGVDEPELLAAFAT